MSDDGRSATAPDGGTAATASTAAGDGNPTESAPAAGATNTGGEHRRSADEGYPPLRRNSNFRRFFAGQFVTNVGDSLYSVAVMWLVFELSGSTLLTGVASAMLLLPYLLQIVAGPIVDRLPVKPILVGTQVVQGVVVLVLPIAAYIGRLTVGLIFVVIPVLASMAVLVAPVRATLVPRIVAEDQLSRSNSALTTITHGLDMIFDALGGLFIALFGATTLFLVDSLTFAVAGVLFLGMAIPRVEGGGERSEESGEHAEESGEHAEESDESALQAYVADLRAGIDILRGTVFVDMLFTSAAFSFALGVTLAILPAFGESLGGAATYGLLLGAIGVGRVVGSATASFVDGIPYGRLKATTYLLSALLWFGAVVAPTAVLTAVLFGLAWISAGADAVLIATLNQRVFPAELLGRISSIKGTASMATLPIGSLIGGGIGELLGTTTTMALAALGFGVAGLYFALHPTLRSLPAIVDVDQSTFGLDLDAPPAATTGDGE